MSKNPCYIELADAIDFSRFVCALERVPRTSFLMEYNGKKFLSTQGDVLEERPVMYYVPVEKTGHYVSYEFRGGKEFYDIVQSTSGTYIYSPIISIKKLPPSLEHKDQEKIEERYQPMELEDLSSLARLSYGFEETPFPLFLYPDSSSATSRPDKWYLGVFMHFSDSDDISCFCYVKLDENPGKPFLRYSSQNSSKPSFSNTLIHGYSYLKIITLKEKYPLVEL